MTGPQRNRPQRRRPLRRRTPLRSDPAKQREWERRTRARQRRDSRRQGLEAVYYADEREACFEAAGWRCQVTLRHRCEGPLEAHHVLPRSKGGTDDRENLLAVCPNGHQTIHSNPKAARAAGLLRRPDTEDR